MFDSNENILYPSFIKTKSTNTMSLLLSKKEDNKKLN